MWRLVESGTALALMLYRNCAVEGQQWVEERRGFQKWNGIVK
jgi:hypothetical protein